MAAPDAPIAWAVSPNASPQLRQLVDAPIDPDDGRVPLRELHDLRRHHRLGADRIVHRYTSSTGQRGARLAGAARRVGTLVAGDWAVDRPPRPARVRRRRS